METQNWYQSRTVWMQVIAVIGYVLSFTGIISIDDATQKEIVDTIVATSTLVSQVLAIYYRLRAKKTIVK